jgi:hypothetical protein
MAYQYSNAAREIASIKTISTRNLLMVLASAVDQKTGTGFWSAECLMHWSQLAKSTFYLAVKELEGLGILKRERRRKGNHTNVWRLDIKKMESMRVSWASIKPKDAEPETDEANDDAGQGLPRDEEEVDEMDIIGWSDYMNKWMKCKIGTDEYYTLSKVRAIMETNGASFARVKEVIEALSHAAEDGELGRFYPGTKMVGQKGRMTHGAFGGPKFGNIAKAYDKVMNEPVLSVSAAFQIEE